MIVTVCSQAFSSHTKIERSCDRCCLNKRSILKVRITTSAAVAGAEDVIMTTVSVIDWEEFSRTPRCVCAWFLLAMTRSVSLSNTLERVSEEAASCFSLSPNLLEIVVPVEKKSTVRATVFQCLFHLFVLVFVWLESNRERSTLLNSVQPNVEWVLKEEIPFEESRLR